MENGDKKEYTGAQMVMESFLRVGVDTIFGLPGGANLPLYDVLPEYYPSIKHYMVKHEQAAAHAADAYARIKGQAGVCYGTSGPGATNLLEAFVVASVAMRELAPKVAADPGNKDLAEALRRYSAIQATQATKRRLAVSSAIKPHSGQVAARALARGGLGVARDHGGEVGILLEDHGIFGRAGARVAGHLVAQLPMAAEHAVQFLVQVHLVVLPIAQQPLDQAPGGVLGARITLGQDLGAGRLEAPSLSFQARRQHGRLGAFTRAAQEHRQLPVENAPCRGGFRRAVRLALERDPFQVFEVVEVGAVERRHRRVHIPRHRGVD